MSCSLYLSIKENKKRDESLDMVNNLIDELREKPTENLTFDRLYHGEREELF